MANIGISRASYYAENAVSKLQVSKSNSMQRLASGKENASAGDRASFVTMKDTFRLDLAANKAAMKSMSVTQGYLATAVDALDSASAILAKLQELAILGANGTNTAADNAAIDAEAEALALRFHNIVQDAQYKGASVFTSHDASSQVAAGSNTALSFGIAQLSYDEIFDHTNPALDATEAGKTYEIIAPLTKAEKIAIALEAEGVNAEDLVVGSRFTTIKPVVLPPGPPPPPKSDNVLIYGSTAKVTASNNVKAQLEAAGHSVTIISQDDSVVPANVGDYDQVWDLRYDAQYDQQGKDIYDSYVKQGGFLYLATEHTGFNTRNATKAAIIEQMGGGSTVIGRTLANNVVIDGQNNTYMTDNLRIDFNHVSSIDNSQGTPLITDSNNNVAAMMWVGNAGDLDLGYSGTVITIADIDWLETMTLANRTALTDIINGVVRGTVDGTITASGNFDADPGVISAVAGKIMLAPTDKLANPMSSGSSPTQGQADNDGDASTAITAINTSKIELVQQRINLARTLAGSQYAAISNAIEHATDLSSQFGLGIDTISDVNFSMETAHLAKDRIQQDAAAAILAQANKAQEGLMMLV